MKKLLFLLAFIAAFLVSCKSTKTVSESLQDDNLITLKFIQLNDVYEIAPLGGGKFGGLERVAHVVDSVKRIHKNTYLFMAGDFLNPSLLGTLKLNGERVAGKQMIDVMNAMDFDLVTFGNHEFDLDEAQLQKRLNESNFQWISSNVFRKMEEEAVPFKTKNGDMAYTYTLQAADADGTSVNIGFFSVTLDANPQEYVFYGDVYQYAQDAFDSLKSSSDLIVGLTHLEIEQDKELSKLLPEVPLIMGGHEHFSMLVPTENAIIAKADANAKTIYIHTLTYDKKINHLKIDSHLMSIDETIASDFKVKAVVDKWEAILNNEILQVIDNPNEIIYKATIPLDGTDKSGRSVQTNLGKLISAAMTYSFNDKEVDAGIVNSGSFRLDDLLEGDVTSLDIFRVLPFGGKIYKVTMKGSLLTEVLNYGRIKSGTGAYLQRHNISESDIAGWLINGQPIRSGDTYTIAMSDFLLKGYDIPFLTAENEGIVEVYKPTVTEAASDIRKAVILYLKTKDR